MVVGLNICYESCDLIPNLGKNYVKNGNRCDCILIGAGTNNCYNNEEECYSAGYRYKYGNQCMSGSEANCKYKVAGETSGFLQRCFPNPTECKNNGFPYYNNILVTVDVQLGILNIQLALKYAKVIVIKESILIQLIINA